MPDFSIENNCSGKRICGVDEAGRGPLAGPVVAAAVIFPNRKLAPEALNDSKKLTEKQRETLFDHIHQTALISVGLATSEEIDRLNILQATLTAMARAVADLPEAPDFALIDGNQTPPLPCPCQTIIKGDGKSASIAAASIIAKVTRDRLMRVFDADYPGYGFASHKGYPSAAHREALIRLGPTPIHRRSFAPVAAALLR